ncbi:hypothetical protein [Sorangium sp. So ce341]|uniref:hypothetical protein n=1 Tax=Sorangium sp. So ce341 TaxID=3133302 RepID=UPI003F640D0B
MTDPERLLDKKEGDLQTALLRAALDESPPSGLTRRTLAALGVATAATLAGGAAEAGASGAAASSSGAAAGGAAAGGAAAGGAAAGAALKVAGAASGGGILSALGIGALAGVLTLGVVQWTGVTAPARRSQEAPAAPAAPEHPPAKAPAALAPPPTSGAAGAEPQHAAEERADEGPPLSRPAAPGPAAPGPAAPGSAAPGPAASARAAPAASSPRAPERNTSTLASELALLDTARRALRSGDPAAALALLDRHARDFADAQLADEAAAIRVEALASQGDRAGARAAARRFLEAHPGSPHADRVESAAGIGAREETVIRRSEPGD